MATCRIAKPQSIQLVGKQQLIAAQWRHGDRCVQRLKHRGEALVRGRQLFADAVGLCDVGHGGHPAGLYAFGIDKRRDIQACIKQRSVPPLDPHLNAARGVFAGHFFAQPQA